MQLGWWGELRGTIESGIELAEKNGNEPWRALFEALRSWLYLRAYDVKAARDIAAKLLEIYAEEPAGQVRTMALLTMGYHNLLAGAPQAALIEFRKVKDRAPVPKIGRAHV